MHAGPEVYISPISILYCSIMLYLIGTRLAGTTLQKLTCQGVCVGAPDALPSMKW